MLVVSLWCTGSGNGNIVDEQQLLEEQVCSLQEQRSRLLQGLLRERQEHIAEAEDMKKRNMEALRQERLARQRRREDALRIRRYTHSSASAPALAALAASAALEALVTLAAIAARQ